MKSLSQLFKVVLASLVIACPSIGFAQTKWDLASAYAPANFHTLNLNQFAADVDKTTNGKLKITVHPAASLFKAPEIKRAVQGGQAQMGEIILVNFENEWPIFGADGLPFLTDSYESAMKLYKAQKPMLEKKFAEQGMIMLYSVPWPPQGIYSKKPINSVADLKGIKWRAYSPSTGRIADLVGAQPVTVQAAELAQAMATGVIEATMTSGATGVDTKMWESMKFYTDTQAWMPKNAVLINKKAFDSLDKTTQDAVLKAGAAAEVRGWESSRKVVGESAAALQKNGINIVQPSPTLKTELQKVGAKILEEWSSKAGSEGTALINNYRK